MKKLLFIGVAALMAACSAPQDGYKVTVNVGQAEPTDTFAIAPRTNPAELLSTAVAKNGKVVLTGKVETPGFYYVFIKGEQRPITQLFLENAEFTVDYTIGSNEPATIKGGGETQLFITKLTERAIELQKEIKIDSLMQVYNTASEEEKAKIREIYQGVQKEIENMENEFLAAHPVSHYALTKLQQEVGDMDLTEAEAKVAAFEADPQFQGNANVIKCREIVNTLKKVAVGQPAIDFTQNNEKDEPVKFSDIYSKNKITMLDCWASWCGPCRRFNPGLVEIYKKYHKKGFEILGVSFDNDKEAWLKAIKDDKLTWPQVSDLGGWKNKVGELYFIKFIPQNVFVDQNGKIVAKKLESHEQIEEFLKENLK